MRFIHQVTVVSALGFLPAVACNSKSNGEQPDAGFHVGDDASFGDSSAMDSATSPVDSGKGSDGSTSGDGGDGGVVPVAAGGTGAFGIITINGKQEMFLPQPLSIVDDAGNAVLAVVDVGAAGNGVNGAPALLAQVDLQGTNVATCTGGDATMMVAASTQTTDVWFISPTTNKVVTHINLDATYGVSGFSGGGGYVTGVAADPVAHIAYLSVWNGFAVADLATQTITKVIQAPPSENFGFDSVHHLLYAPFYDCMSSSATGPDGSVINPPACGTPMDPEGGGVMTAGLSVIDLTDDTVYTYQDYAANDPTNPVGGAPDSASADPSTQLVVVADESGGVQNVLDFSKASFDKTNKIVMAPHMIVGGTPFDGVAIESTSHLAFIEAEGSTDVAVFNAVLANAGAQGFVSATMPALPAGGGSFANLGDPHGIAVTASISAGKPVGFVVDATFQWVARVDITLLDSIEQADAAVIAGTTQINPAVTYLDATTAE